jgi:type II secretory pathway pseudopilin PulG
VRRRGIAMIELLIYMAAFAVLSIVVAITTTQAHDVYARTRKALDDLERAGRCLTDLKRDLRYGVGVNPPAAPGGKLSVILLDGSTATYAVDLQSGELTRASPGGITAYGDSVGAVALTEIEPRLWRIDLTVRKRNPDSIFSTTWSTIVHCRNLAP